MSESQQPSQDLGRLVRRYSIPSLAFLGAVGGFELLRSRFQKSQMFAPTRYPEGDWDPSRHGLSYKDLWFDSEPGVKIHGWWIDGPPDARGTVMYCHGNAGSLGDRIDVFSQLRRLKVNVFAFDYRGFGRSTEATPSEEGLTRDVLAAYACLTGELGVDPSSIIIFGHSMGGAVAINAALECAASGLVVQSSFTDLRRMARHLFPSVPMHWVTRNGFRSITKVGRIAMPKLFLHGTDDPTVPFHMGEELFAAASGPKAWFPVAGADHNNLHELGGLRYFRMLGRFRRRCVG